MAAMQQIHIEVYSFSEEASILVQFDKSDGVFEVQIKTKSERLCCNV
jgi:hypothetical protein